MSLLVEIVDLSVKDDEKVSVLLRKCLVLAAKIKNDKLKEWVQHELNGYPYPNPNSESLPESFSSLSATLKAIGIEDADLNLLEAAVKEDPAKPENKSLGGKVTAWIGNMAVKAATGALRVGTDVGTKGVTEALLKFYGLG